MFAAYCNGHGTRVLLPPNAINAMDRTAHGLQIDFTCTSGHRGRDTIRPARANHQRRYHSAESTPAAST